MGIEVDLRVSRSVFVTILTRPSIAPRDSDYYESGSFVFSPNKALLYPVRRNNKDRGSNHLVAVYNGKVVEVGWSD
ncbi:MAG: hypothetical protein UT34_C0002G0081 [candidate division WS6 bacterium GW2011_GWF2_39_15]|uniref:Uncharacterized protein n=1 Tax=candidate division WS6 bacterium GW2011_GWF2_39_15 TaxID=1619100 RepID=A0A0G0MNA6_9BACT|nr:MAG: hypothetical protein UT34_C0002G0081 [candidate division WS6 bacterium GW2011_GWF2_39_15]